jgi:site-specific DNA recombinase
VTGNVASAQKIAEREKVTPSYVCQLIDVGFLAPEIIAAITDGNSPPDLTIAKLRTLKTIPLDWPSQKAVLGF